MTSSRTLMTPMIKRIPAKPPNSTEFGLHKSQQNVTADVIKKISDMTEYKLLFLAKVSKDLERRGALLNLLAEYKAGRVAIAWEAGNKPIYVQVQKDLVR